MEAMGNVSSELAMREGFAPKVPTFCSEEGRTP
jgi:hypothetical protein